jgi:hypothetical protein
MYGGRFDSHKDVIEDATSRIKEVPSSAREQQSKKKTTKYEGITFHTQRCISETLILCTVWHKLRVIKSTRIRWAGHVVRMGEKTNV